MKASKLAIKSPTSWWHSVNWYMIRAKKKHIWTATNVMINFFPPNPLLRKFELNQISLVRTSQIVLFSKQRLWKITFYCLVMEKYWNDKNWINSCYDLLINTEPVSTKRRLIVQITRPVVSKEVEHSDNFIGNKLYSGKHTWLQWERTGGSKSGQIRRQPNNSSEYGHPLTFRCEAQTREQPCS